MLCRGTNSLTKMLEGRVHKDHMETLQSPTGTNSVDRSSHHDSHVKVTLSHNSTLEAPPANNDKFYKIQENTFVRSKLLFATWGLPLYPSNLHAQRTNPLTL